MSPPQALFPHAQRPLTRAGRSVLLWPRRLVLALVCLSLLGAPTGAATEPVAGTSADPIPDAPGWVAVIIEPENDERILVEARFTVANLFALYMYTYSHENPEVIPQLATGVVATKQGEQLRIVREGEEEFHHRLRYEPDREKEHFLSADVAALRSAFIFYAAGDVRLFDLVVHSGRIVQLEKGPEVWAMWTSQMQEPPNRVYASVSILGLDINDEAYPITFYAPRGLIGEFGGGQVFDPAYLDTPMGQQACECYLYPSQSTEGNYTYQPSRVRGDALVFWAMSPLLPYSQ